MTDCNPTGEQSPGTPPLEWLLSAQDRRFRDEVRDFLGAALTDDLKLATRYRTSVFVDRDVALAWQSKLHERGWVAPHWPVEHGGVDWTPMERFIFETECARAGAPPLVPLGLSMVGPVIIKFGSDAQRAFYLPRLLSGEDYWCQGYSEPGSGSDLASLSCRAVSDDDDYIVDGTKIWTTHAHFANRIFCLVRTSSEGRPQQGISFLLIDMDSPGVTVTPIESLGADHEVNQVFFDGVRVPKANRVGEEGQGWACAKYLLEFERGGGIASAALMQGLTHLRAIAASEPADDGRSMADRSDIRARLASLEIRVQALEFIELRIASAMQDGGSPGPESSMLKIEMTELQQALTELSVDLLGPRAMVFETRHPMPDYIDEHVGPDYLAPLLPRYFNTRAASIYGGTNEIQRSLIARWVLGL